MILYDNSDGFRLIFVLGGSVWPNIKGRIFLVSFYAVFSYFVSNYYEFKFGSEGRTILLGTMSFLLIFRANASYSRYWQGRCDSSEYFSCLRQFMTLAMGYIGGGTQPDALIRPEKHRQQKPGTPLAIQDLDDARAHQLRVDVVRFCIAAGVALKVHTRIARYGYCFGSISARHKWLLDWERFRLRQLLSCEEFRLVDACLGVYSEEEEAAKKDRDGSWIDPITMFTQQFQERQGCPNTDPPAHWPPEFEVRVMADIRPASVVMYFLRDLILRNMNDVFNTQPWGIRDRFVATLEGLLLKSQSYFQKVDQIITTPLPMPYANLCKILLTVFLLSMPFFVDYRKGWFANTVIPSMVSLCLLGIDAIATELEDPFGDDPNDLDLLEPLHVCEMEAVELLRLAGGEKGAEHFCWRKTPSFINGFSCRNIKYQLAVAEYAAPEVILEHVDADAQSAAARNARLS